MSSEALDAALAAGARAHAMAREAGARCVVVGEMGIGNTTSASALVSSLLGVSAEEATGAGTGVDGEALALKVRVVREDVDRVGDVGDVRTILRELGGFEIAAMAGVYLASVDAGTVVVVDGFISSVAALVACRMCPAVRAQLIFSHTSSEAGHQRVLSSMGARPLLDLGMRLGEGSGAMLCVPLVRGAVAILNEMATFASAGVSSRGAT